MILKPQKQPNSGFTLVEIAIVLVIIGLIIGGILTGQDLIKAAEIRSLTTDVARYNAAAGTFRNQYGGLPGDLLNIRAAEYGLTVRDGTQGQGDSNGFIEGCSRMSTALGCETAMFWIDLTDAMLISDAFTTNNSVANGNSGPSAPVDSNERMADYLPTLRLRDSAFIHTYPQFGRNYWFLGAMTATAGGVGTGGAVTVLNPSIGRLAGLTPLEASQIDDKMDDGRPNLGIIRAVSAFNPSSGTVLDDGGPGATGDCVNEGATAGVFENDEAYNVADANFSRELNCNISWRAGF